MSTNTSPTSPLLQLPIELIIKISRELDPTSNDLVNLRNTCHSLRNIIMSDFAYYNTLCQNALSDKGSGFMNAELESFYKEQDYFSGKNPDWQLLMVWDIDKFALTRYHIKRYLVRRGKTQFSMPEDRDKFLAWFGPTYWARRL